ncbi:MAG: AMMECR1 domain-containing protein, partial [Gammaproteobacteria bacterium]|nr:AMMECR1 domain-containing protein [Gammaproteobacteria bacterium]
MGPISLSSEPPLVQAQHRRILLKVAADSIAHGLTRGHALELAPADFPVELQAPRASFVTLKIDDALRGCIGT